MGFDENDMDGSSLSENEILDALQSLVSKGMLEVSGLDEDGEPLIEMTDLGKKVRDEMYRRDNNNGEF